jgi:hypothetical protein
MEKIPWEGQNFSEVVAPKEEEEEEEEDRYQNPSIKNKICLKLNKDK